MCFSIPGFQIQAERELGRKKYHLQSHQNARSRILYNTSKGCMQASSQGGFMSFSCWILDIGGKAGKVWRKRLVGAVVDNIQVGPSEVLHGTRLEGLIMMMVMTRNITSSIYVHGIHHQVTHHHKSQSMSGKANIFIRAEKAVTLTLPSHISNYDT